MIAKKNKSLEAYNALPQESQMAMMALAFLMNRVRSMPQADQDDMFVLINEWKKAKTPEEVDSIHQAMNEIIAQSPVTAKKADLAGEQKHGLGKRQSWASHVGQTVRRLREAAGLTQVDLAGKADIPQSHLSRVENAELSATHKTLKKIADALGVEVGQLDPCAD